VRTLVLSVAILFGVVNSLEAQTTRSSSADGWIEVDGSKTPELIPDVEAWKMMFLNLSDSPRGWDRGSRLGYMAKSGLTEKELDVVIDAANAHRLITNDVQRRYQKAKDSASRPYTKAAWAEITAPFDELNPDVEKQRKFLEAELGTEAYQKLTNFVNTKVKPECVSGVKVK